MPVVTTSLSLSATRRLGHLVESLCRSTAHTFSRISTLNETTRSLEVLACHTLRRKQAPRWYTQLATVPAPTDAVPSTPVILESSGPHLARVYSGLDGQPIQSALLLPFPLGRRAGLLEVGEQRTPDLAQGRRGLDDRDLAFTVALAGEAMAACRLAAFEEAVLQLRLDRTMSDLLSDLARVAADLVGADRGCVLTHRPHSSELEVNAAFRITRGYLGSRLSAREGIAADCLHAKRERVSAELGVSDPIRALFGDRTLGAVAIPIAAGRTFLVLVVATPRPGGFSTDAVDLLLRLAAHVTTTLDEAGRANPGLSTPPLLEILHQTTAFFQTVSEPRNIMHAALTAITAGYGLGFNRAALFLLDGSPNVLRGEMGIGHVEREGALEAWRQDRERGPADLDAYLRLLKQGAIPDTPLQAAVARMRLTIDRNASDFFSQVVFTREPRRADGFEIGELPAVFAECFDPSGPFVVVPLCAQDETIGLVFCDNKFSDRPISFETGELLKVFANITAVAIQNARLHFQKEASRRRLRSILTAGHTLRMAANPAGLNEFVDQTCKAAEADWIKLLLIDDENPGAFQIVAGAGRERVTKAPRVRPDGISMRVMRTGKAEVIEDVSAAPPGLLNPILTTEGVKAALCLPWSLRGKALGVMWVHYHAPRRFAQEEIEDLQVYVDQAAVLWDDARRIGTFAHLARITAFGDIRTTLSSVTIATQRALHCDTVTLYVYEAASGSLVCETPMPGVKFPDRASSRPTAALSSFVWTMFTLSEPYKAEDVSTDLHFKNSRFVRDEGIRSSVAIPLVARGRRVGVLFVSYRAPHTFGPDEMENIRVFADQAAIAIQNSELFKVNSDRLKEREVLDRLKGWGTTESQNEKMNALVAIAQKLLDTDLCCIVLKNRSGTLTVRSAVGWDPADVDYTLPPGRESHAGYTIEVDRAVVVKDFDKEDRFRTPGIRRKHGSISGLGVPMHVGSQVIGAMLVHTRSPRVFGDDEVRLLELIANQVATAIEADRRAEADAKHKARRSALRLAAQAINSPRIGQDKKILVAVLDGALEYLTDRTLAKNVLGTIQTYDSIRDVLVFAAFSPQTQHSRDLENAGKTISLERGLSLRDQPGRIGITGRAVRDRAPVRCGDVSAHPDYLPVNPHIKSELAVPILDGKDVVGVINLESDRPHAFDEEDQETLTAIAELVKVVLRNEGRRTGFTAVTHNILTPVSSLKLAVHNLRLDGPLNHRQADGVRGIDADARRLERECVNFIHSASIQGGSAELDIKPGDLGALVRTVIDEFRGDAKREELNLEVATPSSTIDAEFDYVKMGHVLKNLVDNAIRFTPRGGRVSVTIETDQQANGVIRVRDSGIGIPVEDQERIWDLFVCGSQNPKKGARRSGIGLAIVKEYVEAHGGRVTLESVPDRGSEFTVSFPLRRMTKATA